MVIGCLSATAVAGPQPPSENTDAIRIRAVQFSGSVVAPARKWNY